MKRNLNVWRAAPLFALGVLALWLLRIPQLSLLTAYRLFAVAALSLLAVRVLMRFSLPVALLFVAVTALFGWAMEVSAMELGENAMLPFDVAAQAVLLLVIAKCGGNLYLRIALGCALGALILISGMAGLTFWRKENGLAAAVVYGLKSQWQPALATLVGAMVSGWVTLRGAAPKNPAQGS